MKKLLLFLLLALPVFGQSFSGRSAGDIFIVPPYRFCLGEDNGKNVCFVQNGANAAQVAGQLDFQLTAKTVATLPSAAANSGRVFRVTDGVSVSDCTAGGGSTSAVCFSNGSVWTALGGGGTPGGTNAQMQYNNLGAFGGAKYLGYTEGTTTAGSTKLTNANGKRYVTTDFQFSVSPSGSLTGGVQATVTIPTCWLGIDTSGNNNHPYFVYISTQGTPEAAQVTGGTCTPGATNGTVTFTPANNHASGYTLSSATAGIQEAINDVANPNEVVEIPSCGGQSSPCYQVYSDIFLDRQHTTLMGYGAWLQCNTRDVCLYIGDYSGSPAVIGDNVLGLRLRPGMNIDGVQVQTVQAAAGTYTLTFASNHPYLIGDQVCLRYWSTSNYQNGCFKVLTVPAANQITYAIGNSTFGPASAFGFSALKMGIIEDSGQGDRIQDISVSTGNGSFFFNTGILFDNDQKATLDGYSNEGSGNVFKCTANWCAPAIWSRNDHSYAPVPYIQHADISPQCSGNGIFAPSGNSIKIQDSVIQGVSQYGVDIENGLQSAEIDNVYMENTGSCINPLFGIAATEGVRVSNQNLTIHSDSPLSGVVPNFNGSTSANQINYFIVPHSSVSGVGPVIPIGFAQPANSGVTIPVEWACVSPNGAGTVTYDLLATTGTSQTPLSGTGTWAVATGIASSCNTGGIMSFSDTQAARSSYTVSFPHVWQPSIPFSPMTFTVENNGQISMDIYPVTATIATSNTNQTTVTATQCANGSNPNTGSNGPVLVSCLGAGVVAPSIEATMLISADAVGNTVAPNHKGKLNFWRNSTGVPGHIITLFDSNPAKTAATYGNRPTNDASDVYLGLDQAGGLSIGAQNSVSIYVQNVGDNSNFTTRFAQFLSTSNVGWSFKEVPAPTCASGFALLWADSSAHRLEGCNNNGSKLPMAQIIASGTAAMTTAAITAGNCGATVTVAASGVGTGDAISWSFNAAPAGSNAGLVSWPTANNVNFAYCPNSAETPAAATINWSVVR